MRHKICFLDLDGTVNSSSDVRKHLIPTQPAFEANWAAWHAAHVAEKPNWGVIRVVQSLAQAGWKIILLSMRSNACLQSTQEQLISWGVLPHGATFKSPGDSRKPGLYKTDQISDFMCAAHHTGQELDILVIDDSNEVCKAVLEMKPIGSASITVMQINQFKG